MELGEVIDLVDNDLRIRTDGVNDVTDAVKLVCHVRSHVLETE